MARLSRSSASGVMADLELDSDAFMRSLARALDALEIRTQAQLWTLGLRIQNNARLLCPVDTGRLRSSITATKGEDGGGMYVDIGTNVEYAMFVEFGTRYMEAQPYLRPAIAVAAGYLPQTLGATG